MGDMNELSKWLTRIDEYYQGKKKGLLTPNNEG